MFVTDHIETTKEACARAIEWMGRGHVAHEQSFLNECVRSLRALPLKETQPEQIALALSTLRKAQRRRIDANERRLIDKAVLRVNDEVVTRMDDPMDIYSDRDKWWPRKRAA